MKHFGTIVNGHVRLDTPSMLPEGHRVMIDVDVKDDFDPDLPKETYEEHLSKLRSSIALAESGHLGRSVKEVFDEIERSLDLPLARKD